MMLRECHSGESRESAVSGITAGMTLRCLWIGFLSGAFRRGMIIKKKQKKALPANRFDIPLGHGYWGKYILLLRLCFADPVKRRVYMAPWPLPA